MDWQHQLIDINTQGFEGVLLQWHGNRLCLSSAVLNGGMVQAQQVLNLKVSGDIVEQHPAESLLKTGQTLALKGDTIGMMTAANMSSFRHQRIELQDELAGEVIEVLLTCGLSNTRRAGEPEAWMLDKDTQNFNGAYGKSEYPIPGTINIIVITSLSLTPSCMAEMLLIITEAKCAALQDLNIKSAETGNIATGTGTDSVVIVNGFGKEEEWCGKHTTIGYRVSTTVNTLLHDSIKNLILNA